MQRIFLLLEEMKLLFKKSSEVGSECLNNRWKNTCISTPKQVLHRSWCKHLGVLHVWFHPFSQHLVSVHVGALLQSTRRDF